VTRLVQVKPGVRAVRCRSTSSLADGPAAGRGHTLPIGFSAGLVDEPVAAEQVTGLVVVLGDDDLLQGEQVRVQVGPNRWRAGVGGRSSRPETPQVQGGDS
jgi:hypothetical protein